MVFERALLDSLLTHYSIPVSMYGTSFFYYGRYTTTFAKAGEDCARIGGFLAKLDTPEKFDFVLSHK